MKIRHALCSLLLLSVTCPLVFAMVDDALSYAYECALPYVKEGYTVREDVWGGDLGSGDKQAMTVQLFKGNEYWFCMATDVSGAVISVHVYDSNGKIVETEAWQKDRRAGARVMPKKTGTYYLIVQVEKSRKDRTGWGLVYAYK